jgi:hypothetical protein
MRSDKRLPHVSKCMRSDKCLPHVDKMPLYLLHCIIYISEWIILGIFIWLNMN